MKKWVSCACAYSICVPQRAYCAAPSKSTRSARGRPVRMPLGRGHKCTCNYPSCTEMYGAQRKQGTRGHTLTLLWRIQRLLRSRNEILEFRINTGGGVSPPCQTHEHQKTSNCGRRYHSLCHHINPYRYKKAVTAAVEGRAGGSTERQTPRPPPSPQETMPPKTVER